MTDEHERVDQFFSLPTIARVLDVTVVGPVPVRNSSNATYVLDGNGQRWIRKTTDPRDVLAEAISHLLCRLVAVPVPDGACLLPESIGDGADEDGETVKPSPSWLSAVIPSAVHWSGSRAQMLADPDALGGILAVDAIVGNFDRHNENMLLQPSPDPASLILYGIDFANSWVGTPDYIVQGALTLPSVAGLATDIPMDIAEPGAHKCAEKLSNLEEDVILGIVRSCCKFTFEPRHDDIAAAVSLRCKNARGLIQDYLQAIRASR